MSFDKNYLNFIADLGSCRSWYCSQRKALYYRKLMIYSYLVICKLLTLDQMKQITHCDSDVLIRKDLSGYHKLGEIIRDDFCYDGRYATYSLTKKGLQWITKECLLLSGNGICPPEAKILHALYQSHQKNKPSNHLVCINQILISFLLAARQPLQADMHMERPLSLKSGNLEPISSKTKDHIVPDLVLFSSEYMVFCEADTMQVRFLAPKGPAEKIAKYAMIYHEGEGELTSFRPIHVIFSIQPGSELEKNTPHFSESELKILRNPEKTSTSLTVIRLVAELYTEAPAHTVGDILKLLREKAPYFSSSLVHSPLLMNATILLRCLINAGFEDMHYKSIRNGIAHLTQKMELDTVSLRSRALISSEEKRKQELFSALSTPGYKLQALLDGMSVSCCNAFSLTQNLPCLLPSLYFSTSEITTLLMNHTIINNQDLLVSFLPFLKAESKDGSSSLTTIILKNAYSYKTREGLHFTVCIENITDDIGGYMRACSFMKNFHSILGTIHLLMLVRDDYQLADGNYLNKNARLFTETSCKYPNITQDSSCISHTCNSASYITYSGCHI